MVSFKDILMKHPAPKTTTTETTTPTKETTTATETATPTKETTTATTAVKKFTPILRVVVPRLNNNNIDINTNTNTSDANHDGDDNDDYRYTKSSHNRETKGKMRPDEARRLAWTMQKKDMQRKQQR